MIRGFRNIYPEPAAPGLFAYGDATYQELNLKKLAASGLLFLIGGSQPRRCKLFLTKPEHDSSAEPEIVLAVIQPVRDFCHEVVGL